MSVTTIVKSELIAILEKNGTGYRSMRMMPIMAEVSIDDYYAAMDAGHPIDQYYEVGQEQVEVFIMPELGFYAEIRDGMLCIENRHEAFKLIRLVGPKLYWDHVYHDVDERWCVTSGWISEQLYASIYDVETSDADIVIDEIYGDDEGEDFGHDEYDEGK